MARERKPANPAVEETQAPVPRKKEPMVTMTFDLPHSLATGFAAVAADEKCGKSKFAEKLLRQGLDRYRLFKVLNAYYGETQGVDVSAA